MYVVIQKLRKKEKCSARSPIKEVIFGYMPNGFLSGIIDYASNLKEASTQYQKYLLLRSIWTILCDMD